jgi:hypothetical protein
MDIDLTKYTEHELVDLNRRIVERIRFLRQGRCRESMAEFIVGDRVSFQPERGVEVTGTIVRLNRKSVTVAASDGVQWRVAPTFLRKAASDGEARDDAARLLEKVQGDLIELAERQQRDRGKA